MCLKQSGNTSSNDAEGAEPRTITPAELRRLKDVADLTVRRVVASFMEYPSGSLNDMLDRAYPFGDDPCDRKCGRTRYAAMRGSYRVLAPTHRRLTDTAREQTFISADTVPRSEIRHHAGFWRRFFGIRRTV